MKNNLMLSCVFIFNLFCFGLGNSFAGLKKNDNASHDNTAYDNAFYDKAMSLYQGKRYELALIFFQKAFQKDPMNYRLYFYLGNIYNHKGMFKKSIEAYRRGLEISPKENRVSFLLNLGRSYQASGEYDKALNLYSTVEKQSKAYPEVNLHQGMIYFKLQNKSALLKAWKAYLAKATFSPQRRKIEQMLNILQKATFSWDKPAKVHLAQNMREEGKSLLKSGIQNRILPNEEIQLLEKTLLRELEKHEEGVVDREIEKSILSITIDSDDLSPLDFDLQESKEYEGIER